MNQEKPGILDWFARRLNLTEIFSFLTSFGLFHAELDSRKSFRDALDEALEQPSPSYSRWPRILGLIVVILILLVILTGALLAFYYLPTPESAHSSVGTILRDVHLGWLIHNMHFWGAQLLIAVLIVRMVRFFLGGAYRPPRELLWVSGGLLLLVCLHSDLTGRLLPWTSTAYWSGVRSLEMAQQIPILGTVVHFLFGVEHSVIGDLTLIRFYMVHAAVLPVLALVLIYLQFSVVRSVGLTEIESEETNAGREWFRLHTINLAILLVIIVGLLVTMSVFLPTKFESVVDPYQTVPGIGPPWYLLASYGYFELTAPYLPSWVAGAVPLAGVLLALALPFWDRSKKGEGGRRLILTLGVLALIAWVALTFYGVEVL